MATPLMRAWAWWRSGKVIMSIEYTTRRMPLKIGIVTGEYPPHQGGVGDFTREIAHALADLGHEVHIVTHINARPEGFREAPRSEAGAGETLRVSNNSPRHPFMESPISNLHS